MTDNSRTKEPQYELLYRVKEKHGITKLGLMVNESWNQDPKRTLFTLSRYKFVSRMLQGRANVLEVGCADAFGTRIVQQAVKKITAVDFDPLFIEDVHERMDPHWKFDARIHDMLEGGPVAGNFDAAYALDVLEHMRPDQEDTFLKNVVGSITNTGVAILGHAIARIPALRVAAEQGGARQLQIRTGFEDDDGEVLPRGFCLLNER